MLATIRADLTELLAEINQERGLPADYGLEGFLDKSIQLLMSRPAIRDKLLMIPADRADAGQQLSA